MQKHVNLVDLVKSFPTNIYLQNLASIQKRTSPVKFAHLAEKSGKGSISNLSTKDATVARPRALDAVDFSVPVRIVSNRVDSPIPGRIPILKWDFYLHTEGMRVDWNAGTSRLVIRSGVHLCRH